MTRTPSPVVRSSAAVKAGTVERSRGAEIQILVGPADGAPNFITRRFTLAPGGRIPTHRHDTIEHEQFMLSGSMVLGLGQREVEVSPGDAVFIPPGVAHWYENRSDAPAVFLCIVPHTTEYQTEWLEGPAT
jgi:quercetin dioxygenase-like cupin family protein